MSTFRTAAQRRIEAEAAAAAEREASGESPEADENADPHAGKIAWPDSENGPFHFAKPSTALLALTGHRLRFGSPISAMLSLASETLDRLEYVELELWVQRGDIDLQDFIFGDPEDEVEGGLIGLLQSEATGRPTQPSSASSAKQKTTGRPSTGRVRSKASTPSNSPQTDS